jgi:hypothetical protein
LVLELCSQSQCQWGEEYRGDPPVDDSLMTIVVLVMVVWEFIQRVIPEKTRRERGTQRDAGDEEGIFESPSFRDMQKVDCSFSQRTNEE